MINTLELKSRSAWIATPPLAVSDAWANMKYSRLWFDYGRWLDASELYHCQFTFLDSSVSPILLHAKPWLSEYEEFQETHALTIHKLLTCQCSVQPKCLSIPIVAKISMFYSTKMSIHLNSGEISTSYFNIIMISHINILFNQVSIRPSISEMSF